MTADITYITGNMFTTFFANTKDGEQAWNQIAEMTEGTGKVFNSQAKGTIAQLRQAGYTVRVQPKPSKKDVDAMMSEFDELFKDQ